MNIMKSYRGSISHNLFIPKEDPNHTDDVDLFVVHIAPPEYYIGVDSCNHKRSVQSIEGVYDTADYEFIHFVRMALNNNPNIITALFLRPEHYIELTGYWNILHYMRRDFLSNRLYNTFSGYAKSELVKLKKSINGEVVYLGYMGDKRKELVKKFGYDIKNACNIVRLSYMAAEALTNYDMQVYRTEDRDLLLDIKQGNFSIEEVLEIISNAVVSLDRAFEKSVLPEAPDVEKINKAVMDILLDYCSKEINKWSITM